MKLKYYAAMISMCVSVSAAEVVYSIHQMPIMFDEKRIELTQQYRCQHYGICKKSIEIVPKMIVLHWTEQKTFKASYYFFYHSTLSYRPDIIQKSELNVSAHFLVDRDGTIYQLMPTHWMARHVIGLNNSAIGIENVGYNDLTNAQVKANSWLIRYLKKKYPTIQYLIGHFEYDRYKNTDLWEEKNTRYFTKKEDPGASFMKKVRGQVSDLRLKYNDENTKH